VRAFRRFNVAVTRGMALCVVIGQPRLLYSDLRWRELLKYCVANGTPFHLTTRAVIPTCCTPPCCDKHLCARSGALRFDADADLSRLLWYGIAGAYTGMDISEFLRRPRAHSRVDAYIGETDETSAANADAAYWQDEEDDALLNSVTEVAHRMLQEDGDGDATYGRPVVPTGHVVRGYDMEWRNIL
jgi:hypothetical protein